MILNLRSSDFAFTLHKNECLQGLVHHTDPNNCSWLPQTRYKRCYHHYVSLSVLMCKYDLVCNVINRVIQSSIRFSVFSQSIYSSLFLQGSLVAREASDKERVKDTSRIHILNYEVTSCLRLKACVWICIFTLEGKGASYLQGHGLQEQHAEGVRNGGAEGEVHGESQQRRGGTWRLAAVALLRHTEAASAHQGWTGAAMPFWPQEDGFIFY